VYSNSRNAAFFAASPSIRSTDTAMSLTLRRTPVIVLTCATTVLLVGFGVRQTYGLFLAPMTQAQGWSLEVFSFAMALQTLVWGLTQPISGVIADRFGAGRVVVTGAALYALGLWMMANSATPGEIVFSTGLLTGLGVSGTGFPILLAVVGRSVGPERRSLFLGIASAGGSSGQLLMVPLAQYFISGEGYVATLMILAVIVGLTAPIAAAVAGKPRAPEIAPGSEIGVAAAIKEALRHRGYVLLVAGFFVCGFQTMFIGAHLPAYLSFAGASPSLGATALALIGLFNVLGCFVWGGMGGRFSKKHLLALLYLTRSATMAAFILLPISDLSVILFASATGFMFLATVPLTSGLVAQIFGTQYMAMLYGFVFLNHQMGSFLGIWLGGRLYVAYNSYDPIWWIAIALGFVAALLHWPIDERAVPRLAHQAEG
jgi:MFS family permease